MTETMKQAINAIEQMPDDKIIYVLQIIQGIRGLSQDEQPPADTENDKVISFDESLMDRTGLSKNRRDFLKSAGSIDIDEDAVMSYRMENMI